MDIDFQAILQVFAAEAEENLSAMEQALLELERRPGDSELLHTVFRVAHTLKGDASNLGYPAVAAFAHTVEDLLDRLRDGEVAVTTARVALLLDATDALRAMVPAAIGGAEALSAAHEELRARIAADTARGDDADEHDDGHGAAESAASGAAGAAGDGAAGAAAGRARTLRVDVEKLDRTLNLVGEIAIARGRLAQMMEDGRPAAELLEAHREGDRLHMELQEVVMKLRMVPLGPIFRPFLRTVRDVAFAHGKLARLVIEGEDVEVDTSVVEHLREPLTHLVRNAVDHGIESAAERAAAGKDPCGTVRLSARHEGGSIVIRMRDDGAGLSRERIAARARERGMAAEPEKLSDAELFRLVFEPGFSTAPEVTDLSGRGVGLDVVRRNVEALRGTVSVESRPGEGTTVTVRLPLTLAVIDGFSVGVEGETYVLPLDAVVECLELPAARLDAEGEGVLSLRGRPLPYLRLRDFLGLGGTAPRRESVVVVRHDGDEAGLVVDHLHGDGQAVIKPLGRVFDGVPGFSGSTILGSGRVGLILDVPELLRRAMDGQAVSA